jgi:hypothetical protein
MDRPRENIMNLQRNAFFAAGLLSAGLAMAITGGSVDPALLGTWVPAKAACTSTLKVVVEANKVTFVNGAQQQAYTKLDQCFTCGGKDAKNLVWLSTDAMGDSPFIIQVDTAKKQGTIDFSNDKKLGARFPFGTAPIKRCG